MAVAPALTACGGGDDGGSTLTVAATAVPHAEILEQIQPKLAQDGVDLRIKVFNDYVQPNVQLAEGRLDANYFQTEPYLAEFNKSRGTDLVTVVGVHVEPFGAYSSKHATLAELPDGAVVALPNEPSNAGRALILLHDAGLIRLDDPNDAAATLKDVTANPRNLRLRKLEAAALPRVLNQVDLALINTNYALAAKLKPSADALAIEGKDSRYVNFLVTRAASRRDPRIAKLSAALTSPEVRSFIERNYGGAVLPAF